MVTDSLLSTREREDGFSISNSGKWETVMAVTEKGKMRRLTAGVGLLWREGIIAWIWSSHKISKWRGPKRNGNIMSDVGPRDINLPTST